MKPYYQYAEDVLNGNIVVGEYIRLACKRFKDDLSNPAWEFREDKVDRALSFMSRLKHFKGKSSGQNFILEPWQQWIVANIIGFYHKGTNERRFTSSYIEISRKNGKQLSLDTPIITPNGYTTMGDIKVGDKVFDENGNECNVTYITPIDYKPTSYEITFSDGELIKACKDHNWYVSRNQKDYHIETTQDIIDKGYFRNRKDGYKYYYVSVPLAKPLQMCEKSLPIDPYTLGVWLGDGSKGGAVLSLNGDDCDEIISYIPYKVKWTKQIRNENCFYVSYSNTEFAKALSANDLRNNKHIPNIYLFNSYENRLSLLQGLMDADGSAISYPNGGVQFEIQQKNKNIADGTCFLLSSFGIKYSCREKKSKLYDKDYGIVYRITFNADKRIPPFRLRRKYNLLKDRKGKRDVKYIKDIKPIESVPMRCITVDSPNHLYLCGIKNTVTHNTALAAALCTYFLIADGEDGAEVDLAANSREQAKIAFEFCYSFSKQLDPKEKYLKSKLKGIEFKPNHSKLNVFAADASKLDGFNASFALIDEYHSAKNSKVRDVIKSSMGMRRSPHLCTITTAGFDKTLPCYHLRTTCIEILQKIKDDDSIFIAVYSIDVEDDWTDENAWVKSSPNLDVTVTKKYIKEQVKSALNNPSEEVGVKTKTLNIWCNSSNTWINDTYINNLTRNVDIEQFKGEICYVGVDLSSTSDLTAVSYLIPKDDVYYFKVKYYLPESCLNDSQNKELYKQWQRSGELTITPGNVTDYDYITNDLMKARKIVRLYKIGYDKWNATQWAIDAVEKGLPLEEYSQSIGNFNQPTKEMERLILSGNAVIDNNEITRWCFRNVQLKEDYNSNCLALDTIVPTPNGNTTIGELQVGDYVFGSDGCPTKVTNVTDIHYDRDCYKIKFHNGSEVIADKTHNWYIETQTTKRINGKRAYATHYTYRDTEWLYKHSSTTYHTIYNQAVQYSEKTYTIDPYTLGQWLGDGNSCGSSFTCSGEDLHMYDYLKEKYELRITKDKRERCPNTYEIYVSGGLRTELKNEGLLNNKHIPEKYFYGSVEQRMALVQGLMDTEGTCNKINGQCYFSQKRENIAFGLHRLLNSLGIRNSIKLNKKGYYGLSFYTNERVFRLESKYKNQSKYTLANNKNNYIVSIEKVGSVPTKCITVENENHLFLITDDYLVTSNCKPTKGDDYSKKIDGVIAMIQSLGIYLQNPKHSKKLIV